MTRFLRLKIEFHVDYWSSIIRFGCPTTELQETNANHLFNLQYRLEGMGNGPPGLTIQHVLTSAMVSKGVPGHAQIQRQRLVGILVMVMHQKTLCASTAEVSSVLFKIINIFARKQNSYEFHTSISIYSSLMVSGLILGGPIGIRLNPSRVSSGSSD